jgi:hypothetical protein
MVLVEGLGLLRMRFDHIYVVDPAVMPIFERQDILGWTPAASSGVAGIICLDDASGLGMADGLEFVAVR